MAGLTQREALLAYLNTYGRISPLEALREIGTFRLAARVRELREQGHDIRTEYQDGHAVYRLVKPDPTLWAPGELMEAWGK